MKEGLLEIKRDKKKDPNYYPLLSFRLDQEKKNEIVGKLNQVAHLYNKNKLDDEKVIRKNSILIAAIMRGLKSLEEDCKSSKKSNKHR